MKKERKLNYVNFAIYEYVCFQNYMRVVTARNSSSDRDTVSEYCYKLGLEAGGKETVLGYTGMEGYQVRLFLNKYEVITQHIYL